MLMFMSGLRVSRLQHEGFGVSAELRVTTPLRAVRVAASETSKKIGSVGRVWMGGQEVQAVGAVRTVPHLDAKCSRLMLGYFCIPSLRH